VMRRISEEQRSLGAEPTFFASETGSLLDPRDWLTLIHLLNEDVQRWGTPPDPDPHRLLARLRRARLLVGVEDAPWNLEDDLAVAIAADAESLSAGFENPGAPPEECTLIVEFARGGPAGAIPPLPYPLGYRFSLEALDRSLLERASVLYVWVEPEESRRRNQERYRPGGSGSVLHHGVPEAVMRGEYGTDDFAWLEATARIQGAITVTVQGNAIDIPCARFDNRVDGTSFLRSDPADWPDADVARLHSRLAAAMAHLGGAAPGTGG
jgi:hypothetical protein